MSWVSFYLDRKSAPARVGLGFEMRMESISTINITEKLKTDQPQVFKTDFKLIQNPGVTTVLTMVTLMGVVNRYLVYPHI